MHRSTRTIPKVVAITAVTSLVAALGACQGSDQTSSSQSASTVGHVHGLAVNPADGDVYVAAHNGVFRIQGGKAALVADRRQDTMGFTIAGPDDFIGSGHPDPQSSTPNPLGLIQSSDRAATWTARSFEGEGDFHSIDAAGGRTYAYGSDGRLLMSRDRKSWTTVMRGSLIDIAVDPRSPEDLVATTTSGELIAISVGGTPTKVPSAPPLAVIDRTANSELVGADPAGQVFMSDDNGKTWGQRTKLPGTIEALSVRAKTWYAATPSGVFKSSDQGTTWTPLLKAAS